MRFCHEVIRNTARRTLHREICISSIIATRLIAFPSFSLFFLFVYLYLSNISTATCLRLGFFISSNVSYVYQFFIECSDPRYRTTIYTESMQSRIHRNLLRYSSICMKHLFNLSKSTAIKSGRRSTNIIQQLSTLIFISCQAKNSVNPITPDFQRQLSRSNMKNSNQVSLSRFVRTYQAHYVHRSLKLVSLLLAVSFISAVHFPSIYSLPIRRSPFPQTIEDRDDTCAL